MKKIKELIFNKKIHIQSPATVANIVCGFDILGFAVNTPFDEMNLTLLPETPHNN